MQSVESAPQTYAFRVIAASARRVTGSVMVESNAGWYRIPFKPVAVAKTPSGFTSGLLFAQFSASVTIENAWLSEAASDAPGWGDKGVVACAPPPFRVPAYGAVAGTEQPVETAAAEAISPPFTWDCKTPFAQAVAETSAGSKLPDIEPGAAAAVVVELDESGKPLDVTPVDASNGYIEWAWQLRQYAKTLQYKPAVAYCRAVPSTYILRVSVQP